MSMSQEEIEALMNGLDISENENSESDDSSSDEKDSENMSENDIADLIAQTDLSNAKVEDESSEEEKASEDVSTSDIDELLNAMGDDTENLEKSESKEDVSSSDIDELVSAKEEENNDLEKNELKNEEKSEDVSSSDIDELLNAMDENASDEEDDSSSVSSDEIDSIINGIMSEDNTDDNSTDVDTSEIDDLIAGLETSKDSEEDDYLSGLDFNLDADSIDDMDKVKVKEEPVVSSHKKSNNVVNVDQINIPNQLGQVANDSEEKATKIFDALSYILDDNEELRKTTKSLDEFMQSQLKMLQMLNKKFPNVKEFSENLELINSLIDKPKEIQTRLHNRDKELFDTMELMQFHDINRQKIERVMGLVINLSRQLNSIFDDESSSINLPGANHLPGDNSDDLVDGDDLESLIAEFGK